jgi:hypothetical protein
MSSPCGRGHSRVRPPVTDLVFEAQTPLDIKSAALRLRERISCSRVTPTQVIDIFERWGTGLRGPALDAIPGVAFLRLWLRRGSLEPLLQREFGPTVLDSEWRQEGHARLGAFPLGLVGHWPAGNIAIQPVLSMSCALLGGNFCIVRVPTGLVAETQAIVEKLHEADTAGVLRDCIVLTTFDHDRTDLQQAMAETVDGAMIWGGAEAVSQIRSLQFPHWARVTVFGPRLSVAAMDAQSWADESEQAQWSRRIARDVWQFDQQACSSPQTLFLERHPNCDIEPFVRALRRAFDEENLAHPRSEIHPGLSSAICLKRASWMLESDDHRAVFPATPDWTILLGTSSAIPTPTQGKTLSVLLVDDLLEPISKFSGDIQTLGLAVSNPSREATLAHAAASRGVDRIVKLGRMHVFGSPWDGMDLVRSMTRLVRHMPSQDA